MRAVHICTVLCWQRLSPHTCMFQRCCLCGSLSKAPQSVSLNETRWDSLGYSPYYSSTAAWMYYRKAFKLFPHFGLQWVALHLHSVLSRCKWVEWIPHWICIVGRLCYLSPHRLQPNTLALMGELVKENKQNCIMNQLFCAIRGRVKGVKEQNKSG